MIHLLRNLLVLKFGSYLEATSQWMFLLKCLPQGLFRSEDANPNKLISRCYHASGNNKIFFRSLKNKTSQNGAHEQALNSECTEVKRRFSELLSDASQVCLKTSEITSTNLTIWNDRTCRWAEIWRIHSYYEFARECKFMRMGNPTKQTISKNWLWKAGTLT